MLAQPRKIVNELCLHCENSNTDNW